jgi:hypothetical protein
MRSRFERRIDGAVGGHFDPAVTSASRHSMGWHFVISFTNQRHRRCTNEYISSMFSSARDNKRPNAGNRNRPLWQHAFGLFTNTASNS